MVWELDGKCRHGECVIVTSIIEEGTQSDRCVLPIALAYSFPE